MINLQQGNAICIPNNIGVELPDFKASGVELVMNALSTKKV